MSEAPAPGIHFDVPFDVYRSWDALNWSLLKYVGRSMEAYKYHHDNDDPEETEAKADGRLFHTAALEPAKLRKVYAVRPELYPVVESLDGDWKTACLSPDGLVWRVATGLGKARRVIEVQLTQDVLATSSGLVQVAEGHGAIVGKPWNPNARFCSAWAAQVAAEGREEASLSDLAEAEAMAGRLWALPDVRDLLGTAAVEVSVVWVDPATGMTCKCRMDAWNKGGLVADIKSLARKADNDGMAWAVKTWAYDGQAAMQLEGLREALKVEGRALGGPTSYLWLGVEKDPPYTAHGWSASNQEDGSAHPFIQRGLELFRRYMQQVKYSTEHDWWPGYHDLDPECPSRGVDELLVPSWMDLNLQEDLV